MAKGRVLVVDDEYGIRTGVRQILELEGYEVEDAENGQEALAALDRSSFDIVLIDYRLPDLDGLTLLEEVRRRNHDVMTCMITAYANIETAIAATRQGIDFFLPKPFSPDDLIGVIENLFRHRKLKAEAEEFKRAHAASLLELASEKSQTRSLVSSLRDAVLVINREGKVVLVNPAMAALLQKSDGELLHQPAPEVLADGPWVSVREALASVQKENAVFEIEVGSQEFMVSLTPFHAESGEALGHIITLSDISEVRRLALEKSRFIRTMIHEFRSPMGAVKGILEVALDQSMGNALEPYLPLLARAEARIDGLVELIGNLLSLAQIEANGRKPSSCEAVNVATVVTEVVDLFRDRLQARNLTLELALEPGLACVGLSPEDFRTILTNLVGNAIKYNRDNGQIRIQGSRTDGQVRIAVSDSGLGIQAKNLPHLFGEFFREKRRETRDIEGNGLGLAIVKRLVERASGRIEVESKEGEGSTFSVSLPSTPPGEAWRGTIRSSEV